MESLIVLILAISMNILSIDINTVRNAYKEAAQSKTKVEVINKLL